MDPNEINPGPIDAYVLHDQDNHVSSAVWDGQERGVLRCHEHTSKLGEWRLTAKQIELVEMAGFGYLRQLPSISLDNPLISALVERWRKETNTFHMTVGEMTITLRDVAFLLGLAIDGEPVLGVTYTSCKAVCEKFLGKVPEAGYMSGGMVKLSWLKEYFTQCSEDAPLEEVEQHTRAYLLYLVGSTIFSTTTGNKVPVMYLPLFENFEKAGRYAWGAAALGFLYRSLGNASLKSQSTISGCLTLLQCWSYFYLNIGRPKFYQEPVRNCFPLVFWWKGKQSAATVKRDIIFYRKALDSLKPCDVEWFPFGNMDSTLIPGNIRSNLIIGRSKTMLICFDKAERHLPDRCLRQYGMCQGIPEDVEQWERKTRGVDSGIHLSGKMESELNEWSSRRLHIVEDDGGIEETEYMYWYLRITRKFVGRPMSPLSQIQRTVKFRTKKKRMNAGLRDIANIADTFSTKGLDPLQTESISRIRAIAHACLGDQVGADIIVSSATQIESGKRREKEHVRRNANGKRKRKDDLIQYGGAEEDDQVLCGISDKLDPMQLCHAIIEVDHSHQMIDHSHTKLGKRVRRKDRSRKKTSRKRRRKEYMVRLDEARKNVRYNATVKDDQLHAAGEDQNMNLFYADDEVYHSLARCSVGEDGMADSYCTSGECGKAESSQLAVEDGKEAPCHTAGEGEKAEYSLVAGEDREAVTSHESGEVDNAVSTTVAENIDESKVTYVTHDTRDFQSLVSGESLMQTAKVADGVVFDSLHEPSEDVVLQIDDKKAVFESKKEASCHAAGEGEKAEFSLAADEGEKAESSLAACEDTVAVSSCEVGVVNQAAFSLVAKKIDGSKLTDVTHKVGDLNQSLLADDSVMQNAKEAEGVVPESSHDCGKDVPLPIAVKKAAVEGQKAASCQAAGEGEKAESFLAACEDIPLSSQEATEVSKALPSLAAEMVVESKVTVVIHKVGDLNQCLLGGESIMQTDKIAEGVAQKSSCETSEDAPLQIDCNVAMPPESDADKKVDESQRTNIVHKVEDLNQSLVDDDSVTQTAEIDVEVVPMSSHKTGADIS